MLIVIYQTCDMCYIQVAVVSWKPVIKQLRELKAMTRIKILNLKPIYGFKCHVEGFVCVCKHNRGVC